MFFLTTTLIAQSNVATTSQTGDDNSAQQVQTGKENICRYKSNLFTDGHKAVQKTRW
ncbi:MAG: hypothetical protein H6611_05410 [Ignavibacteriales bacterium]|nr:hypothetical protein [Ignavibacteriales bacterium]